MPYRGLNSIQKRALPGQGVNGNERYSVTIVQLKMFLLDHIRDAVEVPAASCGEYTKRQMWEFYDEFCNREIRKGNHKLIIAESLTDKVLKDFPGKERTITA